MENEITLYNAVENELGQPYCSMQVTDEKSASMLFKAMNQPDDSLGDHINETIDVTNIFIQPVPMVNNDTGEMNVVPRIVLFDAEGKTYVTVSRGIYNALKNMCTIVGTPETWKAPITIKVGQRQIKERRMFTFDVVSWNGNLG